MTHKEKFIKSDHARGWTDLTDGAQFIYAADMAMLEFQNEVNPAPDMATSAAQEWKRQGAKRFLQILQGLALPVAPQPPRSDGKRLDYSEKATGR